MAALVFKRPHLEFPKTTLHKCLKNKRGSKSKGGAIIKRQKGKEALQQSSVVASVTVYTKRGLVGPELESENRNIN